MKTLTADINLDEEVTLLADFIGQKWTPIANLDALFTEIRVAAMKAARSWFESHSLWEAAHALKKERKTLLRQTYGPMIYADLYDALYTLLDSISGEARDLSDVGRSLNGTRWDFETRVRNLELRLCDRQYPDLSSARPLGWAEMEIGYKAFDGQDEYDPRPDQELFKGVNVQGARSADFPGRIALPYVICEEKNYGRRASYSLVGAVYAHFLGIAEFLNTHKVVQDLNAAFPQLQVPEVLYERVVTTENPFLKVAVEVAPPVATPAQFQEHLAQMAAFEALSDEEKALRKAEGSAAVLEMLDGLNFSDPEEDRKYAAEKERKRVLLRAAFEV
jgi:hypothetical protein